MNDYGNKHLLNPIDDLYEKNNKFMPGFDFNKIDENNNGLLSRNELENVGLYNPGLFQNADKNNDGMINPNEFGYYQEMYPNF